MDNETDLTIEVITPPSAGDCCAECDCDPDCCPDGDCC
jgi:hypothetical protein